jgi:hypothetical protein
MEIIYGMNIERWKKWNATPAELGLTPEELNRLYGRPSK